MENEMEKIKIKLNKAYFVSKDNPKSKLKIIQSLQYITILLIFLLIILSMKDKIFSYQFKIKQYLETNNSINLYEKIRILKLLTNNDELEYKGVQKCLLNDPDKIFCIYHLIIPKEVIGKKRMLLGDKSDGCYVLLDDFENIKIAYSFGISTNIQFDKALADKGIDVYMYDHTINSLPYQNPKFHWKKIGLCGIGKHDKDMKIWRKYYWKMVIIMNRI